MGWSAKFYPSAERQSKLSQKQGMVPCSSGLELIVFNKLPGVEEQGLLINLSPLIPFSLARRGGN